MTGSLRLASFPGTQLLVPPRAGSRRAHTNLAARRNVLVRPCPASIRNGPDAARLKKASRRAGPGIGNQIAGPWFHTRATSLGGGAATQHKVLPGLQQ